MVRKISTRGYQQHLTHKDLLDQLNPQDPLLMLGRKIDWAKLENTLAQLYAQVGRPAKSIRLMAGLLMLKQLENLSDERLIEQWVRNPYFQAFCGEQFFQWKFPCNPSELTYFRRRLGETGSEEIFKASVSVHGNNAKESDVVVDTTVQEKNIAFPTDTRLHLKIVGKCVRIAKKSGIKLRRSYKKEVRGLARVIHFSQGEKQKRARQRAKKRIKTLAGVILRDIQRKISREMRTQFAADLALFERVLQQKKDSKNKVYSLHEPQVECIAKGKAHKKYEFGTKAGLAMTKITGLIVGVKSFTGNPYDGDTLDAILAGVERSTGQQPIRALCDRGFRGHSYIGQTKVHIPQPSDASMTAQEKLRGRRDYGRRSAIEPVIGHVKNDHRMARCMLKGILGDAINLFMAAAAFNLKKWMRKAVERLFSALFCHLQQLWAVRMVQVST